jgi:hypothetical protein
MARSLRQLIDAGVRISDAPLLGQDKIWSKFSNDKVDIGETLSAVIRRLSRALPLSSRMRALSIGSSNEPQFRLLQTSFQGGLYLLDIEKPALDAVQERIRRQQTRNVITLHRDYTKVFMDRDKTRAFKRARLDGRGMELVTLAHSLYYCEKARWGPLLTVLLREIVAPRGALYAVLMAASSEDPSTTTWLYNHFAGRFCGHRNDQDLRRFGRELEALLPPGSRIRSKRTTVRFWVDDFEAFMGVVWMILLYPHVHRFTLDQRREIAEHVYRRFFEKKRPLLQEQDHLIVYRGVPC